MGASPQGEFPSCTPCARQGRALPWAASHHHLIQRGRRAGPGRRTDARAAIRGSPLPGGYREPTPNPLERGCEGSVCSSASICDAGERGRKHSQWGEALSWQRWRAVAPEGCTKERGAPHHCCASPREAAQAWAQRGVRGAETCLPPAAHPAIGAVGSAGRDAAPGVPSSLGPGGRGLQGGTCTTAAGTGPNLDALPKSGDSSTSTGEHDGAV